MQTSDQLKEVRKQRAKRALWRCKVYKDQICPNIFAANSYNKRIFKIEIYADGEEMEQVPCTVCSGMPEEEKVQNYMHIDKEGFHCDTDECKERFHEEIWQF